ncbi:MAG: hypothetical protein KAS62_00570 [Candidatus Delongbacteria bacterium]|nr:hypothetical protein [Candidatus Delongbacteria bacterium]
MFKFIKRIKESIDKMLLRMAETNRKEFGSKRMDCCDINKPKLHKPDSFT